ncbi:hypothetical protein L249_3098 [Ophiocordyceps polyrhachis-furcata BCC 54312]|uniref:Uncharacterized protein n=1 Tax=Ophiocordyceps polyrhachis-furcata BCC 54312 TaxID=1330021 RepID=A0A367LRF9_9HYPO|nr:hypothetical protein L249_3098 [Ophiocordyceps polyrhachis-furcata BCC 54312]
MSRLPALAGHVFLRGRNTFMGRGEEATDHEQLPQFLPRTEWPYHELANDMLRYTSSLESAINFQDEAEVRDLVARATPIYSQLVPMPPYHSVAYQLHDNVPWLAHVAILHDLIHRTMASHKPLSKDEMFALMRIVSYGMYHSVAWLYPWHIDLDSTGIPVGEWSQVFNMHMSAGDFRPTSMDHDAHIRRVYGRRWVVVPIRCGEAQWNMAMFDRSRGLLYVLDCGAAAARSDRIKACVELWVRFWNWMHLPYDFQYLAPAATGHASAMDSGLIAITWLMSSLRDQVGDVTAEDDDDDDDENKSPTRADFVFTRGDPNVGLEGGDLHPRDWLPDGCRLSSGGLMAVRRIVKVMICNELGLAYHETMTKKYRNHRGRQPAVLPSALMMIRHTVKKLKLRNGRLRTGRFWTAQGGPQFALPQRMMAGDYKEGAPRRHKRRPQQEFCLVETSTEGLTYRNRFVIHWPAAVPYTDEFPLSRPAHGVELETESLSAREDLDDAQTRHFEVTLANRAAEAAFRRMGQVQRVVLGKMRRDRSGGLLKLTLGVGFADEAVGHEVEMDVEMTIPADQTPTPPPPPPAGGDQGLATIGVYREGWGGR